MASFAGTTQKCKACEKTVYLVDELTADNKVYHKACFRCHHCKGTLKVWFLSQPFCSFPWFNNIRFWSWLQEFSWACLVLDSYEGFAWKGCDWFFFLFDSWWDYWVGCEWWYKLLFCSFLDGLIFVFLYFDAYGDWFNVFCKNFVLNMLCFDEGFG